MIEDIFGKVLQSLRKSKNLTQDELAALSDLDRTYISLLERGLRVPTIITLFKLAKALELPPEEILREVREIYENR